MSRSCLVEVPICCSTWAINNRPSWERSCNGNDECTFIGKKERPPRTLMNVFPFDIANVLDTTAKCTCCRSVNALTVIL